MKWASVFFASLLSLAAGAARADPIPAELIGTWRLVSNTLEEIPSGAKTDLFGPNPIGYIMYGADGRMMILQVRSQRPIPAAAAVTSTEAEALFRSLLAYGGTYSVSGDVVTHHVDISWNQSWTGTEQVRHFKFEGNRVELATDPSPDPIHGKMSVRRLVWEKLAK
jgi:Lipocalin-like domain